MNNVMEWESAAAAAAAALLLLLLGMKSFSLPSLRSLFSNVGETRSTVSGPKPSRLRSTVSMLCTSYVKLLTCTYVFIK